LADRTGFGAIRDRFLPTRLVSGGLAAAARDRRCAADRNLDNKAIRLLS